MLASLIQRLKRLSRDECAPAALEHIVVLVLIVAGCLVSLRLVSTKTDSSFQTTAKAINHAQTTDGEQDANPQW